MGGQNSLSFDAKMVHSGEEITPPEPLPFLLSPPFPIIALRIAGKLCTKHQTLGTPKTL